ncbi:hypothetical protein [Thermofilum sp.]|jgi:hypothetical protein|nr:hypothetical protein [Thermofilum sp.]
MAKGGFSANLSLRGRVEWGADHEEELKELEERLALWFHSR